MLSMRLWRTITQADNHDPIFRRVSQMRKPPPRRRRRSARPRLLWLAAAIAAALVSIVAPQSLLLVLIVPISLMTLMVAAPVLLPACVWLAGALSTGQIISGICREKSRYTYELICASSPGKLRASWSFATGSLHRGGYFLPLRWGTRTSLRVGIAVLAGLTLLALLYALSGAANFGIEQLRLFVLLPLILAVYFTNMTQSFVLSHTLGLLASSFEWAKRDAMLAGLLAYTLLNSLPLAGAALVYISSRWLAGEPHPLARLLVEASALLLIVAARELTILALWSMLKRRMDSRRDLLDFFARQLLVIQ